MAEKNAPGANPTYALLVDARSSLSSGENWRASLAFVDQDAFQYFMGAVIIGNLLVLVGETDAPDMPVWEYCDNAVLILFFVEVTLKMLFHGLGKYCTGIDRWWNALDLTVVGMGVMESWVIGLLPRGKRGVGVDVSSMLRVMRLMRLLRLLRLFRVVRQLMALLFAFRAMIESFVVVFGVLSMLVLACGIVCTELLGHVEVSSTDVPDVQVTKARVQANFRDVPTSMFSLFQVTTLDNWIDIAQPAIDMDMRWQGFFVVFICVASWTMISILTAVASENVVESAMGFEEAKQKMEQNSQAQFLKFLRDAFVEADADGNGLLDKAEFETLIHSKDVIAKMRAASSLTPDDLMQAWQTLDVNRTGELTIDEFVSGFAVMNESLSTKHIASLDYTIQKHTCSMLNRISSLNEKVTYLKEMNDVVLKALRTDSQRHQLFAKQMWAWREHAITKAKEDTEVQELKNLTRPRCLQEPAAGRPAPEPPVVEF